VLANADMGLAELRDYWRLDDAGKSLLRAALSQVGNELPAPVPASWCRPIIAGCKHAL
jgi:hypothetical protein